MYTEKFVSVKNMFLDMLKSKNRIIKMNKNISGMYVLSFKWNNEIVSPKTDWFLFISHPHKIWRTEITTIKGSTEYLAFKHLRDTPINKWIKVGLPHVDVQKTFCKKVNIKPPYNITSAGIVVSQ